MPSAARGNKVMFYLMIYKTLGISIFIIAILNLGISLNFIELIILNQIMSFFVPFMAYKFITKQTFSEIMPMNPISIRNVILIAGMLVALTPFTMFLSALSSLFATNYIAYLMEEMVANYPFILMLLAIGVTPSIMEELMFRGAIYNEYRHVAIRKAAFVNGLFFGLMHMSMQQFLYAAVLGFLFTYFMYYTKTIFAPIIAHFFVNGPQVALMFAVLNVDLDEFSPEGAYAYATEPNLVLVTIGVGVVAILFMPLFFYLFREFVQYNKHNVEVADIIEENIEVVDEDLVGHDEKPAKDRNKIVTWAFVATIVFYILYQVPIVIEYIMAM